MTINNLVTIVDAYKSQLEEVKESRSVHDIAELVDDLNATLNSALLSLIKSSGLDVVIYQEIATACEEMINELNSRIDEVYEEYQEQQC